MTAVGDTALVTSPALCVVARGGKGGRAVCERVCPAGAIRVGPPDSATPGPAIDGDACRQCHLCVRACPTGAIHDGALAARLEAAIRRRLRTSRQLVFRCAGRHDRETFHAAALDIVDDAGGIVLPCLGIVSLASLAQASACGAESVVFDNRLCPGCSWRAGTALALQAAARSQSLLRLFGRDLAVRFAAVAPRPAGITRRQLFRYVRAADPEDDLVPAPRERLLLSRALRRLGAPATAAAAPGEGALWAVAATDACDCCGACAALCPTQALQFRESAQEATLVSHPVLCTGCALCLERCPRQALVWRSPASTASFAGGEGVTLAHSQRDVCEACSRPMERWRRGHLCADCHVKQAIAASFAKLEGAL